MKKIIMTLIVLSIAIPVTLIAGDKEEIIEQIMKGNAYMNKNKKTMQEYCTHGSVRWLVLHVQQKIITKAKGEVQCYFMLPIRTVTRLAMLIMKIKKLK